VHLSHSVESLRKTKSGRWRASVRDGQSGEAKVCKANFVFLGAGGGARPLLQKAGGDRCQGYGGFPVGGQWAVGRQPESGEQLHSKVYGKAAVGAPPMSVPHLDTRIITGQPALLFGPFAGFTTKFLKKGSVLDLFTSVKPNNLAPMMA